MRKLLSPMMVAEPAVVAEPAAAGAAAAAAAPDRKYTPSRSARNCLTSLRRSSASPARCWIDAAARSEVLNAIAMPPEMIASRVIASNSSIRVKPRPGVRGEGSGVRRSTPGVRGRGSGVRKAAGAPAGTDPWPLAPDPCRPGP